MYGWLVRAMLLAGLMLAVAAIYWTATAQVSVPPGCVALAQREGYPTDVLTRAQLAKARVRLAFLSRRDPFVRACKDAIKHLPER